jgi:alkanesulfonate monooxygenase SsuD/methylene tetrahydromethanopterin reductase-like flavin-dependent oxidoreductase (luciferase family)
MRLGLRYDLRSPSFGASAPELWAAALDQCTWADRIGVETVFLGEHHGDVDGYNPAPVVLAAAILGRTTQLTVHISALVAPLHDPVRLAEDLAALSLIGPGRVEATLGLGYRPHELAMFGVDPETRQRRLDTCVDVLARAWRGERFEVDGRPGIVRPLPPPGKAPRLYLGGSTESAARRAARAGKGFRPGFPALWDTYAAELRALSRPVPDSPPTSGPTFLFVTHEPEADLARLAPNLLDTTNTYAHWALERGSGRTKYQDAATAADLVDRGFRFVTPAQCLNVADELGPEGELRFHPLMGGIDPSDSWRSLELFEREVLPMLEERGWRPPRPPR